MAQLLPVDEFDLIIFGGTGDLAMRKLQRGFRCQKFFPAGAKIAVAAAV